MARPVLGGEGDAAARWGREKTGKKIVGAAAVFGLVFNEDNTDVADNEGVDGDREDLWGLAGTRNGRQLLR